MRRESEAHRLEERVRLHLREALVAHSHQSIHRIIPPITRKPRGGSKGLTDGGEAAEADHIGINGSRSSRAIAVRDAQRFVGHGEGGGGG